jgi:hypothetical protein
MDLIRAPDAWASLGAVGGRTFRGAVVDSGANHDHPDLLGQTNKAASFSTNGGTGGYDVYGHGEMLLMVCVCVPGFKCIWVLSHAIMFHTYVQAHT